MFLWTVLDRFSIDYCRSCTPPSSFLTGEVSDIFIVMLHRKLGSTDFPPHHTTNRDPSLDLLSRFTFMSY